MTSDIDPVRLRVLEVLADAYNRHDAEAIMGLMSDDCEFVGFSGPEPHGERFTGRTEVEKRVRSGLAALRGAQWTDARHHVAGDRGFSEWTFVHPQPDGTVIRRDGIDVIVFRGERIASKSTFQKWVEDRAVEGQR